MKFVGCVAWILFYVHREKLVKKICYSSNGFPENCFFIAAPRALYLFFRFFILHVDVTTAQLRMQNLDEKKYLLYNKTYS